MASHEHEDTKEGPHPSLRAVVDALVAENLTMASGRAKRLGRYVLPSHDAMVGIVEDLRSVLFPAYLSSIDLTDESMHYYVGAVLDRVVHDLQEQIRRGLWFTCGRAPDACADCDRRAEETTFELVNALPRVRQLLATDVQAAYEGDPAAGSPDEALFSYPGILATTNYRIAHELYRLKVPLIPRIITELAHSRTGIDIHPGARIGGSFFIDHGTGVVIGETSVIGERVRLYQGVTLGAKSFPLDEQGRPIKGIDRHPIVEDDVIIYAGATILGRVTIGKGSVIGGNTWLTRSVPPGSRVNQGQEGSF